jgi:hypothetical protein
MAKRVFDLVFSLFCLVVAAPVMLIIAILIKLDSSGPILYVPQMVGKNGRWFPIPGPNLAKVLSDQAGFFQLCGAQAREDVWPQQSQQPASEARTGTGIHPEAVAGV